MDSRPVEFLERGNDLDTDDFNGGPFDTVDLWAVDYRFRTQGWAPHFKLLMKPVFWPSWKPELFAPEKLTWIDPESSCAVASASQFLAVVQACWLCSIAFFSASRASRSSSSTLFCLFKTCRLLSLLGWVCWLWNMAEALTARLSRPSVISSICILRSGSVSLILSLSFLLFY